MVLDGQTPQLPNGVLDSTRELSENRITWQPRDGVRIAAVIVSYEDGYGEFDEEGFMEVPRSEFPDDLEIEEGVELNVTDEEGQNQYARVESVTDETVRLDFNHPLAGAELHFNVTVVALREPTAEELDHGHVHEEGHHH